MDFQDRVAIARELLVVQAMCRSAESNLGIESVNIAVVVEHIEQARKKLEAVARMLQPPDRVTADLE
jgi:alpha-D-ribose 1-methylphosphonate 5-triphosphate synthase subunit PhnL